jgi:hypothetical protein
MVLLTIMGALMMLDGLDVTITQKGQVFTVSGKDAEKLHVRIQSTPAMRERFVTGALSDGVFTLEKTSHAAAQVANAG